jgi:predicted acylesterase/phospholipase RssA
VIEKVIDLEMVYRKGLALGGGGSRGDFQAGALLYLYEQKGFRPQGIAGTSVGAINAIELSMGDNAVGNAAARLVATWLSLTDESDMWADEPWLASLRPALRRFIRSISIEGLLALPYAVFADIQHVSEISTALRGAGPRGPVAIFNIGPIEARARAVFDQVAVDRSGIKVRLIAVSSETGELVMVDERGGVLQRGPRPMRPPTVPPASPADFIDGAIASATMPGVFPARRLADHMCVDGGVKEVVPVQVAVHQLGCSQVFALRCSAKTTIQATDPARTFPEILARSVLGQTFDEVADNDVAPIAGWGEGVSVVEIGPRFDLHDPIVVEPGLIRIALDYGWMCAADVLDVREEYRAYASDLTDRIIRLRAENWTLAHWAAGARYQDPHRSFTQFVFANVMPPVDPEIQLVPTPEAVDDIRSNCRAIRDALEQRSLISAPLPPSRNAWFTQWELTDSPPQSSNPWAAFVSRAGNRPHESPPSNL